MPRFLVSGEVTITISVYVEADDAEAAKTQALEEAPMQGLCYQCSKGRDDEWSIGELDGEVDPKTVVVEAIEE